MCDRYLLLHYFLNKLLKVLKYVTCLMQIFDNCNVWKWDKHLKNEHVNGFSHSGSARLFTYRTETVQILDCKSDNGAFPTVKVLLDNGNNWTLIYIQNLVRCEGECFILPLEIAEGRFRNIRCTSNICKARCYSWLMILVMQSYPGLFKKECSCVSWDVRLGQPEESLKLDK